MLQRTGEAETITTHYLAALGAYRALYIPNWIYRYVRSANTSLPPVFSSLLLSIARNKPLIRLLDRYFAQGTVDPIAVVAGIVQTGLYLDFFYVYFTKYVSSFSRPAFGRSSNCAFFSLLNRVLQGEKFELPA
jgi:ER lumen protein retaining receptor